MSRCSRRKGYALSILMVALVVISIGVAAAIPILSMKKDTLANTSKYVKECIVNQSASNLSTTACAGAVDGLTKGFNKDYESVLYYLSIATYRNPALNIIKASCDEGGSRACDIFIDRCAVSSSSCNLSSSVNDLYNYITMTSSDVNDGKSYLATKGADFYLQRMTNFNTSVKNACNGDMTRMACDIAGETKTMTYNLNVPQRSDFDESAPDTGTQFHDGIVDLYLSGGGGASEWAKQSGGPTAYETGYAIAVSSGYAYITGTETTDPYNTSKLNIFIMKVDITNGSAVWKYKYGTTNANAYFPISNSIAVSGSNVYITGADEYNNLLVMKVNASDGAVVWRNRYGGSNSGDQENDVVGTSIAVSGSSVYVGGYDDYVYHDPEEGDGGSRTSIVMKLNESDGSVVWKKRYGTDLFYYTRADEVKAIKVIGSYIYITGTGNASINANTARPMFVAKLNESDGSVVWKRKYGCTTGGIGTAGYAIDVSGSYVYVAGFDATLGTPDIIVMKLNDANNSTGGTVVWKNRYGGNTNSEYATGMVVSGSYIYVSGHEMSDTAGGNTDLYVMKLQESNGVVTWKNQYGGTGNDNGRGMAVPGDDYIYVIGDESSNEAAYTNIYFMRIGIDQASSNITGWTLEGTTLDTEPIVTGTWTDAAITTLWTYNGTAIGDWGYEGTTIDTELINDGTDGWFSGAIGLTWQDGSITFDPSHFSVGSVIMPTNFAYMTTTDDNHIPSIIGGVKSFVVDSDEPTGTKVRWLVSFDGRDTWNMWNGSAWVNVSSDLSSYDFSTDGNANTTSEIEAALTNRTLGECSLDYAVYLETDSTGAYTPSIDSVSVTYLKER